MLKMFKPGDKVKAASVSSGKVTTKEIEGVLVQNDSNTTLKGVMTIVGDTQRMMFMPDGTIYCHPQLGVVLTHISEQA